MGRCLPGGRINVLVLDVNGRVCCPLKKTVRYVSESLSNILLKKSKNKRGKAFFSHQNHVFSEEDYVCPFLLIIDISQKR